MSGDNCIFKLDFLSDNNIWTEYHYWSQISISSMSVVKPRFESFDHPVVKYNRQFLFELNIKKSFSEAFFHFPVHAFEYSHYFSLQK